MLDIELIRRQGISDSERPENCILRPYPSQTLVLMVGCLDGLVFRSADDRVNDDDDDDDDGGRAREEQKRGRVVAGPRERTSRVIF